MFYALASGVSVGYAVDARASVRAKSALRSTPTLAAVRASGQALDSSGDYLAPALALLPPGQAFALPVDSLLHRLVDGLARMPATLGRAIDNLGTQILPGGSGALLADWERAVGVDPAEVQGVYDEMVAVDTALVANGHAPPSRPSLDDLRAAAVLDRSTDREPFTLDALRRRARQTVFGRYVDSSASTERAVFYDDVLVTILTPFRVGTSTVGDALASDEWRFAFDCVFTVQAPEVVTDQAQLTQQAERVSAPLWSWIRRRLPPWCGIRVAVATADGRLSAPLFAIRFPFPKE